MRALLLLLVAALAIGPACGDDDLRADAPPSTTAAPATTTTESPREARLEVDSATGEIAAPGFNEMIDDQQPASASTAAGAAEMLVDWDGEGEKDVRVEGESSVVVTVSGLADDSVAAIRYELRFVRGSDGLFRFREGTWSQRCQPDRGHDDVFLAKPCV